MKTNNRLLKFISSVTNIAWYLNIANNVFFIGALIVMFFIDDHISTELAQVKFREGTALAAKAVKHIEPYATSAVIFPKGTTITLSLLVSPTIISYWLTGAITFAIISTGILKHLRNIFKAIKHNQPFHITVVKSLKWIALLLACITPLHLLYIYCSYMIYQDTIVDFDKQMKMVWSDNFIGPILGAVIYVIADIFRYGSELKKETEEFV